MDLPKDYIVFDKPFIVSAESSIMTKLDFTLIASMSKVIFGNLPLGDSPQQAPSCPEQHKIL